MTRQVTDQLYIDLGYLTPEDYYTYQTEALSDQTAETTITCDASVIAGGVAVFGSGDLTSFATLTCTISHINGADLFAFSEAALAAQAEVIRTTNVELSTQFSVAVSAVRGIYVSAQADSFVDMFSAGSRSAGLEAAVDAAFSMDVSVSRTREDHVLVDAAFSMAATASIISSISADLSTPLELSVISDRICNFEVSALSITDLELQSAILSDFTLDTGCTTELTVIPQVIRYVSPIVLSSNFSLSVTGRDLDLVSAALVSAFTAQATAKKTARLKNQNISSTFSVVANVSENPNPNPTVFVGQGFQISANFRSSNSNFGTIIDLTGQSQTLVTGVYTPPIKVYLYNQVVAINNNFDYLKIYMPVIWRNSFDGKLYTLTCTVVYRIPTEEVSALANGTTRSIVFSCPDIQNIGSVDIPHETVYSGGAQYDSNNFDSNAISWTYGPIYYPNIELTIDGVTKTWEYALFCDSKNLLPIGFRPRPSGSMINDQTGTYTYTSGTSNASYTLYSPSYQLGSWVIASADLPSVSALYGSLTRVVLFESSINSNFTQSTTGLRLKRSAVTLQSTSDQSTIGQKNAILASSISTTAALVSSISRKRLGNSQLTATTSQSTNATVVTVTNVAAQVTTGIVIANARTRACDAQVTTTSNLVCAAQTTARTQLALTAFNSQVTAAAKIGRGLIGLDVEVTMEVQAKVTTDTPIQVNSTTGLTAIASNVLFGDSQALAETNLTVTNDYLRRNESIQEVQATVSITAARTRDNSSISTATTSLLAVTEDSKIPGVNAQLESTTAIAVNNQVVRLAQADLQAIALMPEVIPGVMVRCEADLIVEGFVLTAGQILHIDPYYQLKIEPEHRGLIITQEHRVITIEQETRVNKISGYKL